MERKQLILQLADLILLTPCPHPLRVAIDGVDASGKTWLADELAEALSGQPRPVIRASVDGFHNPKAIRRQMGRLSPEGFYLHSYQYPALIRQLLLPLGPGGSRHYRTAVFDVHQDQPVDQPTQTAQEDAILLLDGIFLLRPGLLPYWDLTIFLQADFVTTLARGVARDAGGSGTAEEVRTFYEQRYIPGQIHYLHTAHPENRANILIDNNDLQTPKIIRVRQPNRPSGPGESHMELE